MSELRVLVLTPDFPPDAGGIQVLVHRVISGFTRSRALVVAINDPGAAEYDRESAIPTRRAGLPHLSNRVNLGFLNVESLRAGLVFRPDVILSAHIMCAPAALVLRRVTDTPYVQYVYADEIPATPNYAAFAMRHARAVIAISTHTHRLALEAGADPQRMPIITPGVDFPPDVERTPAERPTVLTVARMDKQYKGHDVMLRAMPLIRARVPDVRWAVVGDGNLLPTYRRLVAHDGLEGAVEFLGRVSDDERDRLLRSSHVFAMPSRLRAGGSGGEGFGIVYVEAAAHGLPTVAGNVGGALDAIADGETGDLVDPRDHVAVAEAIITLLLDRERAERMGAAGRVRARDFAWPRIARRVEDLLLAAAGRT